MSKILITGGAGYVGAVLVPYLLQKGHKITVIDLMIYGEKVLEENPGKVKNPDDLVDKYLSGTYLITALRHMIAWNSGKPVYTMVADVTKDALGDVFFIIHFVIFS